MTQEEPTAAELCDGFADIYTGAITDTLDELGYKNQTLDPEISPLLQSMSVAGVAFPIRGNPNKSVDPEQNIRAILEMLGDTPQKAVLMYDTNDEDSAHIGELTTTALQKRGCRGAVVDGGARDIPFIAEQGFPVFRRYDTPADCVYRWEIIEWDVSTSVGGVKVHPGDIVVGDPDGVVVVPQATASAVYQEARNRMTSEDRVRDAVEDGVAPLKAYDEYGAF
jgi:4-hydroxy-4-methyl-2-oxoglutarate aldolase